jgi:hypothetical protein
MKKKGGYNGTREEILSYDKKLRGKLINLDRDLKRLGKEIDEIKDYYGKTLVSKTTGFVGIGSLIVAFYFLAPNFTGNVIGNVDIGNTNLFGSLLFLFGLFNVFICLKNN